MTRRAGRSASSRSPQTDAASPRCCAGSPASCCARGATTPRSTRLIADARAGRGGAAPRVAGRPRHRGSAPPSTRDGRVVPRPRPRHRRVQPVLPRVRDRRSTATGPRARSTFPIAYEGPPGHRARRLPRGVLRLRRCSTTTATSAWPARRRRSTLRYRRPTPLLTDARASTIERARRRRPHPLDRAAARTATRAVRGRRCDAVAGDRGAPARGLAPPEAAVTAAVVDAGDGLPLTVPALLLRRAPAERPRRRPARVRRRRAHLRARPTAARPTLARALLAVGAGQGHPRRAPAPERARRSSSAGWPRPASARSACRSARSRPAPSCRRCCAAPTSSVLLARRPTASHDYVATPAGRRSPSSTSPRRRRCSPPASRRCAASRSPVDVPDVDADWTMAGLLADAARRRRRRARRRRGRGHAGRPHGDRAHVGLDQRAEGRHPRPRRR